MLNTIGGGRNEVSPRLMRRFHMIWLVNLHVSSMTRIFTNILNGFISTCTDATASAADFLNNKLTDTLVQASIDIYTSIQAELLPTPLKSHYTFNLRDLSKVFQGNREWILLFHYINMICLIA